MKWKGRCLQRTAKKKKGMKETDGEGAWHWHPNALATHLTELLAKSFSDYNQSCDKPVPIYFPQIHEKGTSDTHFPQVAMIL